MPLTKAISLITATAFLVSTVIGPAAYAASTPVPGVAQMIKESLSAFQLPYSLGRVTDAKYLGSRKVVVAIQDLHCHPEVQRNISGILGILDDMYGKRNRFKVLVEGGAGPVDTSWLNKISDPTVRANAVEALMNAGRLTGAEYYSIQTKQYGLLQGLEDEKPYFENLARLNQIMDVRGDFIERIDDLKAALAAVTKLYYTAGNRRLDKIAARREAGVLDTEKYYKMLLKLAARERIARYNFPAIANFMEIMSQQRRLSYAAVNKQLTKFLETLKEKLSFNVYNQLVEKASRPNGIEDVYVILAKAVPGMDISQYPQLAKFFRFIEVNQKMNPVDLVKEERALLGELRGRLSRSRAEREVAFLADFLQYVQGYYENRMSADDYDYYITNAQAFYELWGRYADARLLPSLDAYKNLFGKFYQTNIDRNRIFMDKIGADASAHAGRRAAASMEENIFLMNTQLSLAESDTEIAVVVTGGFHTRGLAQMLEEKGISYVVITPNVTGGTAFAQRMYDLFARELSGQTVAQGKISRSIAARPANPSLDSYGLWLAASSDASLSADALVSNARDMGLQSAVVQLAAQGMTAAQIVKKLNEQNLQTILAGLGYKGPELLNISTADGASVVFSDSQGFVLSIPVAQDPAAVTMQVSSVMGATDRYAAELKLLGVKLGPSDLAYGAGLYDQYSDYPREGPMRMGRDSGELHPSAMLAEEGEEALGVVPIYQLDELNKNKDKYIQKARTVVFRRHPMNGGSGSAIERKGYLTRMWERLNKAGEVILGSKATDLFIDVEVDGEPATVSISEAKLLRALEERSSYKRTIVQEFASAESKKSIDELLDTVNVYARIGKQREGYGGLTYREILTGGAVNISYGETVVEQALPTIKNGKLSNEHLAPSGHGQVGVHILLDALECELPTEGPLISAIFNEDGINNAVDPVMVGWMAADRIPIAMVTTPKTSIDKKGGLIGIVRKLSAVVIAIMEHGQAEKGGQREIFEQMGLTLGKRGAQYFNTNTVLVNISLLQPFLKGLVQAVGYDEFVKIISPTLIQRTKNQGGPDEYVQLEGALGSVLLNLDAFLSVTDNADALKVMKTHGLIDPKDGRKLHIVRMINVSEHERTRYFTPIKTTFDYWLQFHSDLFRMNTKTWALETNRPGFIPEVSLSEAYYSDVQNVLDAFGNASTVGLDSLKITGKVLLNDAVLKGKVVIKNDSSDVVNLNDPRLGLPKGADGRLLLEDVEISIGADGTVTRADLNGPSEDSAPDAEAAGKALPNLEKISSMTPEKFIPWAGQTRARLQHTIDSGLDTTDTSAAVTEARHQVIFASQKLMQMINSIFSGSTISSGANDPQNAISTFTDIYNISLLSYNNAVDEYNRLLTQSRTGNGVALTTKWTKRYVVTPLDAFLKRFAWISPAARQGMVDIAVGVVESIPSLLGPAFAKMHYDEVVADAAAKEKRVREIAEAGRETVVVTRAERNWLMFGGISLLAVSVAALGLFGFDISAVSVAAAFTANVALHVTLNRLSRGLRLPALTLGEGADEEDDTYDRLLQFIPGIPARKAEIMQELEKRNANTARYLEAVRITADDIESVRTAALARINDELNDTPAKPDPNKEIDRYNVRRTRLEKQQRELQTFAMHNSVVTNEDIVALLQLAPVELLDRVLATNTFPQRHVDDIRNEQGIYYLLGEEIALLEEMSIPVWEPGWSERIDAPLRATSLKTLKLHENFVTVHDTKKPPTLRLLYTSVLFNRTQYMVLQSKIRKLSPVTPSSAEIDLPVPVPQQEETGPSIALLPFPGWVAATAHPFIVPQTLSAAVGKFLENPINYTVLHKGVHAVVVPRLTTAVEDRAIMRARKTGATVAIIGSIDASGLSNYKPINGSGYWCREIKDVSKGKVVEIVFVRDAEKDDRLMRDALDVAYQLSGDLVVCGQVDTVLAGITDYRNGLQVSVLELGYRNTDSASVTKVMSHMATKPVVVMSADATGEAGNVATDGELWPVRTQADYIAQMHWLNDRALYKNSVYVQPVSAVAAISPRKLDSEESIVAMLSDMDRHLENLSRSNIDTLLLNVAPDAWADAAVQLQLKRLIDTLRMKGIRVGFFEDVDINSSRNPGRFRVMGSLAAQRNGEEVMVYLRVAQQDARMGAVTRDIERLASRAIPGVKVLREDSNGIRDMAASSGAADPSYLLASETLLSNSSEHLDKAVRSARMIILDAPVTEKLQSDDIRHLKDGVKNHWQDLHGVFSKILPNTPAYALAKGVSDARRGMVKYDNRDYAKLAAAVAEAMQDPRAAGNLRFAVQATAEDASVRLRVNSILDDIWKDKALDPEHEAADAAYRIGFVRGLIEQVFAREEIVVDGRPVELSPDARQQYAAARLQQWLLRVAAQPAQPLRDIAKITGIDNHENIPQYRTDIPALPRMTAQGATVSAQNMVDVLARIARTARDAGQQKYALAGIIELLRLYGERNIPETIIEQTNDVVKTELLKALLGAA